MASCNHCDEFSRAQLLRASLAKAGGGLPAVERGMPLPAGTGLTRRSFVARAGGLALAVFGGGALRPEAWEEGIAAAMAQGPRPILVSVFLSGGVDSLSVLAPVGHSEYSALRPTLAVARSNDPLDVFLEDSSLQWHPMARPLRDLHLQGKLTVLPSVGYEDPNQSHFTSRHYWEVGKVDPFGRTGWLGRYLDLHGDRDNPLQGLSLNNTLAPSLATGEGTPVAAVAHPESYPINARDVWDSGLRTRVVDGLGALGGLSTGDAELAAARRAAGQTVALRRQLEPLQGANVYQLASASYPANHAFPRRLAALAEMIERGLPVHCVALNANGGYDTHDNQLNSLPRDLDLCARSLAAFQQDLEARGLADRVLTLVWSEFGRRAKENGTGTDHGAGGLAMVMGTRASGRMVGEFPGLGSSELDARGNLKHTADFRGVYRALLEQWLGVDPAGILPDHARFTPYRLVK